MPKRGPNQMYSVFIFRYDYPVYHLSMDDKVALCGRDIGRAEYIGEVAVRQDTHTVSGRCCKLCQSCQRKSNQSVTRRRNV